MTDYRLTVSELEKHYQDLLLAAEEQGIDFDPVGCILSAGYSRVGFSGPAEADYSSFYRELYVFRGSTEDPVKAALFDVISDLTNLEDDEIDDKIVDLASKGILNAEHYLEARLKHIPLSFELGKALNAFDLSSSEEGRYYFGSLAYVLGDLWDQLCESGEASKTGIFTLNNLDGFIFNTGSDGYFRVWDVEDCGLHEGSLFQEPYLYKYPSAVSDPVDKLLTDTAELGVIPVELLQVPVEDAEEYGSLQYVDPDAFIQFVEGRLLRFETGMIFTDASVNS